jgi:GntR family transcriptional regulator
VQLTERQGPATARLRTKYQQLYEVLRERVLEAHGDPGRPMTTEHQLVDEFGVSRVTVRKALELLENEGLIVRRRRLGIFPSRRVVPMDQGPTISSLSSRTQWLAEHSTVKVIACNRRVPPSAVAHALRLTPKQRALYFERVRFDESAPLAYLISYLAPQAARLVTEAELAVDPPLVLLQKKGMRLERAEQTVTAENADADVARWLEVESGAAVIRTSRTTYDVDDSPVSIMTARIRPDRYELRYTLSSSQSNSSIPEVWRI